MAKVAPKLPSVQPRKRLGSLVRAIESDDEVMVERLLQMSRSHRAFAPLALTAGAFAMLLHGVRLLLSNWRLLLVEALPAMWIWLAMADLKLHVLHGASFRVIRGPILIPIWLAIVALTAAAFFLNAVFAFAIAHSREPNIRPAFSAARRHAAAVVVPGAVIGVLLALSTTVVTRSGRPWFALSLGIVVGAMMVAYVALPARLIGSRPAHSKRDKLAAGALGGLLSMAVCTPPYLLARLGILLLGSLLVPGIALLAVGATLQAGATGAVRAIKMSASLTAGRDRGQGAAGDG
ncbi:MAG TPA: hypothetical protein VGX51_04935 [Solirubrobacteraceae bacterium]|jgi:hypothetical protein|nr:hypothetical protein [Solirubrobacteraceae bacterium]